MTNRSHIQELAQKLRQAAGDHNWPAVMVADRNIAALLTSLHGQMLNPGEMEALQELQKLHHQVNEYCQGQSDVLEEKMARSLRNREGAVAYAAFMDSGDLR